MKLKASFLILAIVALCTAAGGQSQNTRNVIEQILKEYPVAGLSVAVVKGDKLVYSEAFGFKDLETEKPLSTSDLFRIASISKSFTATSIMQLVERKKLKLEDDISKLLGFKVRHPKFPDKVITLKMILSHTSALNDSEGYFTLDVINPEKNRDWQKCFNDYEPGTGYEYCNLNFNMAGTILEKVSRERFDHYVANHILKPLNLYGGYNVNELDASRFATIYEYNIDSAKFIASPAAYAPRKTEIDNYKMGYSTPIFSPTGGMKISAPDLARYMMMHMNGGKLDDVRIISKKSEKIMRQPLSQKEHYGLALLTTTELVPGQTLIGHTGSAYGLFSAMFFEPEKKFGIVVISNGCDPREEKGYNIVIRRVVNALYENWNR